MQLIIFVLFVCVQDGTCNELPLLKALDRVPLEIIENGQVINDVTLQGALQGIYRSEGLAPMIQLWKAGKQWPAELSWWRSPYPNSRKLAIALFYTAYPDTDVPQFPRFEEEAERFSEAEAKMRKAELAEVLDNLPAIKARLEPLLKKN